ncbi:alpha/beta hydrolase [Priestia koreensis]|uniref:alpha/beta hydrolase n=1 Tax=Priestia koreensis TaxID=284581 RepID=UPI0030189AD1
MKHIFQKGTDEAKPVFLLLHGTGGTETDLLPIAGMIDPKASFLSVRGNVVENGMPRFFRRLQEGVFDIEDLILRTKELKDFIEEAAATYHFDLQNVVAVGYSNGANIAGSLLFHYENVLRGAILLHPMVPRRGVALPSLANVPIFIGAGDNDPICLPEETNELSSLLTDAGAKVAVHWESFGHQLTRTEIEAAKAWYEETFSLGR